MKFEKWLVNWIVGCKYFRYMTIILQIYSFRHNISCFLLLLFNFDFIYNFRLNLIYLFLYTYLTFAMAWLGNTFVLLFSKSGKALTYHF